MNKHVGGITVYKNILDILICPKCGQKLMLDSRKEENGEVVEGTLKCPNNHQWRIEAGIIDFESKEQEMGNNWSESYEKVSYEELDKLVTERTPKMQQQGMEITKTELIKLINKYQCKKIIDIATGRGMLLTKLVENYGKDIELTCVDLSFEVLKYDRIKAMKINPDARINYVACDATNLPFMDGAFDLSVSFYGIQNMGPLITQGVKEGVRAAKNGLLNVCIVIKDDNPRIAELNKMLLENGYDFKIDSCTESNNYNIHRIDDSYFVEVTNAFEEIAEKNENDILPIEGEWFAYAICKTTHKH